MWKLLTTKSALRNEFTKQFFKNKPHKNLRALGKIFFVKFKFLLPSWQIIFGKWLYDCMMILNQICSEKNLDITKTTRKVLYSITNFFS